MALLGSLGPDKPIPSVKDIENSIQTLPSGIGEVLHSALTTANGDIVKVRDGVAEWFDTVMDRLSGQYKRQARWMSLAVGIVIAVGLNVDSIAVGNSVWRDETMREQLAASAENFLKERPVASPTQVSTQDDVASRDSVSSALHCHLQEFTTQVERLRPLPIGWSQSNLALDPSTSAPNWWAMKLAGLLWTGLALSLGAPFWFDVLDKFMNIRVAGRKPTKAGEQA